MAVNALYDYQYPAADTQDKFHGNQLLYVGWDDHFLFAAPLAFALPPSTKFSELVGNTLKFAFGRPRDRAQDQLFEDGTTGLVPKGIQHGIHRSHIGKCARTVSDSQPFVLTYRDRILR